MAKEEKKESVAAPEKQRGTQDELEILRLIINENPSLRQNILDRLRQAKNRASMRAKAPEPSADAKKK